MSKQAKKAIVEAQNQHQELKAQEMDLQIRFSKLSPEQRSAVGQYLNAYNLAAWIYNELIDEDCRIYIDLAMKYTMETQKFSQAMRDISDDPNEVQQLVDKFNNGEESL